MNERAQHPKASAPAEELSFAGRGLFTGKESRCTISPAAPGSGLRLRRAGIGTTDHAADDLPIHIASVATDTSWTGLPAHVPIRNTTLRSPRGDCFATVEHMLSALAGLGIWDALIGLEEPEAPIMDGSSLAFARAIHAARSRFTPSGPRPIRLTKPVRVAQGPASIEAYPLAQHEHATYSYTIDYGESLPTLRGQCSWRVGDHADYLTNIAPARTFSLSHEAHAARSAGLFTHLLPSEMLVLDAQTGAPIGNELRFSDEPCRHKLLDLIGDLALLGAPLHARVAADRSGHALTHRLCGEILASIGR